MLDGWSDVMVGFLPFPFDHFFFCFLPPVDAAGAWEVISIGIFFPGSLEG